ncbi:unnamed protein product [Eruca vesicaria subsp. sativa]|uniref:Leucine-rich repeat-containing N-terminal plant-type domain-containing protein n=1 Tax=Eruca vesicaria subsp. sativa TaxID=29727 RepID=A0ABC8KR32_ERUVS|nr:unnamed protein product [Eruca vesicaria subsp. sativa]
MVDLSANTLYGDIPPHVNSTNEVVLLLQDNHLSGAIPDTLLLNVSILDLRNNRLSGNIPEFINTKNISILLLRENNLTGLIPQKLCSLRGIYLLDLSNNRLNGSIPSCLRNISFGLKKHDTSNVYGFTFGYIPSDVFTSFMREQDASSAENIGIYFKSLLVLDPFSIDYLAGAQIKIEFATKHRYDTYMGGNLLGFSGLDLSVNELSGEIPVEVGSLVELHALNFSHNSLSGVIPTSFSGMKKVESLDLSFNRLQGQIPTQLTDLNSLAVFNVSFNNLSRVIPLGKQFNTFDTGSYLGNHLLCGKPTNISCNGNNFQEPENNEVRADDSTIDMLSFYWSFTAGYVIILLGIFTSLSFDSRWSRAWFFVVDAFIHKEVIGKRYSLYVCHGLKVFSLTGTWNFSICIFIYNGGGICIEPTILTKKKMERKFFLGQYLIWVILLLGQLHGYKSCVEKERKALLDLKKYIFSITIKEMSDYVVPTWSYEAKSDCCRWDGVKCNPASKRVTHIDFGDLYLKDTYLLNLSLLHSFEDVRSLSFHGGHEFLGFFYYRFNGVFDDVEGYKSLSRLRNLEILDLSSNEFNSSIFPFLNAATSLTTLSLRDNDFDGPFPAKELKDLTNLELLDLSENKFNGPLPMLVLPALRNLKALDLSGNEFFASMGLQGKSIHILCYFIKVGGELTFTDVYVNLHLIITGICEMKNMQELDLSHNKLEGQFPLCLTDLTRLRVLDLSSNQLIGKVPSSLGNLRSLKYLSLLDNNFEGFFSLGSLANLSELRVFKLGSKSKSFQVKSKSNWKPKFQLSVIELPSCNLVKVPCFLLYQKDLSRIDLSNNKMSGDFPHWLLVNNSKLEVLFLQNNSFTSFQLQDSAHNLHFLDASANDFNHMLPENIGWILPHLHYMKLANNGFHGFLPSSLGNMEDILYLDLSHNSFHGTLPRSFLTGCYSMAFLTLSHNKLSGEAFSSETVNFPGIKELSMDNNLFTGKIGQGLRSMEFLELLDISNNNLTGIIPSWIGEFQNLQALLLSNNSLEGEIPISLFNLTDLELLDLSANILSGGIPPKVNSTRQVLLLLQDNNLSGAIPDTLLINVTILDLRNNRLSGNIPEFSNTQDTHTLLLRGNDLSGSIPHRLCGLRNIKLLDLADNRLNGSIPSCFSNTSFSFGKEDSVFDQDYGSIVAIDIKFTGFTPQRDFRVEGFRIYFESLILVEPFILIYKTITRIKIEFATKHRYDTYLGENLKLLFGMDLSKNELSGDIPTDLGGLLEIQSLNLSHNSLSGLIPKSFSGLKNVESLDLSFNRLQDRIPSQLTELCNLAVFNVSFNNLSGVIPQGKQFNTFDAKSYLGNPLLCGQSINTSCDNSHYQEPENGIKDDESKIDMVSFYWSVAAAYVTILLGIFTSLSFDSPWRRFWFSIVDAFIHKAKNLLLFGGAESIHVPSSSSSYTEVPLL